PALGNMTITNGGLVTLQRRSDVPTVSLARAMVVSSLSFGSSSPSGKLDIKDNDLIINYTGSTPIGSWNGTSYTGVAGYVQSGRNGGGWDGNGITTSLHSGSYLVLGVAESSQVKAITGTQTAVFDSATVDSTAVLVTYTYGA